MRLLSGKEILEAINSPDHELQIQNFSIDCLQHSAYYVRLGPQYWRITDSVVVEVRDELPANGFLRFQPGEYVHVQSLESFRLGASVLGILGGVSDTPRRALSLVAGQFVDPLYPSESPDVTAPLDFGLKNESQATSAIQAQSVIAKICFFDVSDSRGIEIIPGSRSEQKFTERIHAMDARLKPGPGDDDN